MPPAPVQAETTLRPAHTVDPALVVGILRHGPHDPTMRVAPGTAEVAFRTAAGPVALQVRAVSADLQVIAWAWSAEALTAGMEAAPALLGCSDHGDVEPRHPLLARLRHRLPGLRLPHTGRALDALVPAVVEQRVQAVEAYRSHAALVRVLGEVAPGPLGLRLPPTAASLLEAPSWTYRRCGIEHAREATIRGAASRAAALRRLAVLPAPEFQAALRHLRGVGPWTAAETSLRVLADADAVPVGDAGLPHLVCHALAGERRGDDERMLELLEPYRGQRGRVIRLLMAGATGPPRRAPLPRLRGRLA